MVQWRFRGSVVTQDAGRKLLELPIVEGEPVRLGSQWQNRPNQHGVYFWQRTGRHIWYESSLEASCLVELDQGGEVDRILAQPFRVLFRHGSKVVRHDPDFFAVLRNGDQVVYDVKPARRMTEAVRDQFEETARVCGMAGWRHAVLHEPDRILAANLAFLRNARHSRAHPDPVMSEQIGNVFSGGRTLGEGREMVNRRFPALAMPFIKHLIWHRRLSVDPTERLDFDTVATTVPQPGENRCCA